MNLTGWTGAVWLRAARPATHDPGLRVNVNQKAVLACLSQRLDGPLLGLREGGGRTDPGCGPGACALSGPRGAECAGPPANRAVKAPRDSGQTPGPHPHGLALKSASTQPTRGGPLERNLKNQALLVHNTNQGIHARPESGSRHTQPETKRLWRQMPKATETRQA